uniref:Uncharacterized protein n=1 Tax=Anguilla anguilla TaxID=7936 RepID=A0A0E9SIE0_ANGAN
MSDAIGPCRLGTWTEMANGLVELRWF